MSEGRYFSEIHPITSPTVRSKTNISSVLGTSSAERSRSFETLLLLLLESKKLSQTPIWFNFFAPVETMEDVWMIQIEERLDSMDSLLENNHDKCAG